MIPLPEPYFDVRVSALNFKIMGGKEKLTPEDLRALPVSTEIDLVDQPGLEFRRVAVEADVRIG